MISSIHMELVKLIHDLAITAGFIALAILLHPFIIACLALRRRVEEKRSPDSEFQPFRLEFIRSVTETCDKP